MEELFLRIEETMQKRTSPMPIDSQSLSFKQICFSSFEFYKKGSQDFDDYFDPDYVQSGRRFRDLFCYFVKLGWRRKEDYNENIRCATLFKEESMECEINLKEKLSDVALWLSNCFICGRTEKTFPVTSYYFDDTLVETIKKACSVKPIAK